MFSDDQFLIYVMCMFIIIMASRQLLSACSWSLPYIGWCNILMMLSYAFLMYIVSVSINKTKDSKDNQTKTVRHLINFILMSILVLTFIMNSFELFKNGFKKKQIML